MTIARYWDGSKDDGSFLAGVPSRDLTEEEYEALPAHLQRSVDAAAQWRKTKPRTEPAKDGD